jgi:hypothetical protein
MINQLQGPKFDHILHRFLLVCFQKSLTKTFGDDKYSLARKEVLTNMYSRPMQVRGNGQAFWGRAKPLSPLTRAPIALICDLHVHTAHHHSCCALGPAGCKGPEEHFGDGGQGMRMP